MRSGAERAEQSACCTIGEHASHHRHIFFDSVQPLLALSEQRALCTFFPLLLQASLQCCGMLFSSPGLCFAPGRRLPEALFMVFQLDSKSAKVCISCRSRQELLNQYSVAKIGFDRAGKGPLGVCQTLSRS